MKKNILLSLLGLFSALIYFSSCQTDDKISSQFSNPNHLESPSSITVLSQEEFDILNTTLDLPNGLSTSYDFQFSEHAGGGRILIDKPGATLGRVLFYDKDLSIDREISCASCHKQELGFADDAAFSEGVNNNITDRNSLAIGMFPSFRNYYRGNQSSASAIPRLFWDDRASTPIEQMSQTFVNPKEMGIDMTTLVQRVSSKDYYQILFDKAFDDGAINDQNIKLALRTFMSSFHSSNTHFDRAYDDMNDGTHIKTDFINFSASQNLGKKLFADLCMNCHGSSISNLHANSFFTANNGLDQEYTDKGLGEITNDVNDYGKFKIPALRNIELTAPYMHDGRFETLEEVIDFYNDGIQGHSNLHPNLKTATGEVKKLNFSDNEKTALISFLKTLTDSELRGDKKYSNPFKD